MAKENSGAITANTEEVKAPEAEISEPKMVEVYIPKTRPDEEDVFVSVNLRTYIVKRGERVMVPEWVAEVLERSQEQKLAALENMSRLASKN